jgi:hypothetical protein
MILAGGLTKVGRENSWRTWLVRLTALVFVLQSVGLFAAPSLAAPGVTFLAGQADAPGMAMPDCPHHKMPGHRHDHDSSGACPMCQTLGFALADAPPPGLVARANQRLIGLLSVPAPQLPPRAPPLQSPPPRGPPVLV